MAFERIRLYPLSSPDGGGTTPNTRTRAIESLQKEGLLSNLAFDYTKRSSLQVAILEDTRSKKELDDWTSSRYKDFDGYIEKSVARTQLSEFEAVFDAHLRRIFALSPEKRHEGPVILVGIGEADAISLQILAEQKEWAEKIQQGDLLIIATNVSHNQLAGSNGLVQSVAADALELLDMTIEQNPEGRWKITTSSQGKALSLKNHVDILHDARAAVKFSFCPEETIAAEVALLSSYGTWYLDIEDIRYTDHALIANNLSAMFAYHSALINISLAEQIKLQQMRDNALNQTMKALNRGKLQVTLTKSAGIYNIYTKDPQIIDIDQIFTDADADYY